MENLNAEQIKYCLELILKNGIGMNRDGVDVTDIKRALALINSQEQRIGAQDMTISELRKRVEKAEHDADRYAQRIKELTEENERLSTALANYDRQTEVRIAEEYYTAEAYEELREENERLRADCAKGANALIEEMQKNRTIEADTVKEFAEKFIAELRKDGRMNYYIRMTLDQIAKEMLEGVT